MKPLFLIGPAICLLIACASYQVVRIPVRDASLYPISQTLGDITVGIDAIEDSKRAARYFGVDLLAQGIMPVIITVTNHGAPRAALAPANILLREGNSVVDPLPLEHIIKKVTRWRMSEATAEQTERYLRNLSFQDRVLMTGDTYRGVLFFPLTQERDTSADGFTVLDVFSAYSTKLTVVVTDLDGSNAYRFGPFTLRQPYYWPN